MSRYPKGSEVLTSRKEKFCQLYAVEGLNATEAYMTAYNNSNKNTARKEAYKLKRTPEVAKRINDLRDRLAYKLLWSKAQAEEYLTQIVKDSMDRGDAKSMTNAINAIKELNKMCGYHAPTKTESINIDIATSDIDSIMKNLGFTRTERLTSGENKGD